MSNYTFALLGWSGLSLKVPVLDGLVLYKITTSFQGMVPSYNSVRELVTKIRTLMMQPRAKILNHLSRAPLT